MTLPPTQEITTNETPETDESNIDTPESEENGNEYYNMKEEEQLQQQQEEEEDEKVMNISYFYVGQYIDVLDSVGRWSEAEVLKIDRDHNRIFVTFLYWQSKWDTWVDNIAERTAPFHSRTYVQGQPLRSGQRISVKDNRGQWLEAFVIEELEDRVKVHYRNYSPSFDEYILRIDTDRYRQFGPDKKLKGKSRKWVVPNLREEDDVDLLIAHKEASMREEGQSPSSRSERKRILSAKSSGQQMKQQLSDPNQERQRQIIEFSERYDHYIEALSRQNLEVHPVDGDGNCMFRAVAHQVYGDENLHMLVREKCMDYMESQAEFYCQFVVGGMQMFPLYIAAKRQSGCWGDDPEIQAMCEMYGRPAYIWAYDSQRGAKNLRTFHEAAQAHNNNNNGVIRLSYYGGGHYDSIHKFGTFDRSNNNENKMSDTFIHTYPGVLEESAIRRAIRRQQQNRQNSSQQQQEREQEQRNEQERSTEIGPENSRTSRILDQELALVAEAKRVSEQEVLEMDFDLAIRASRNDLCYWEEEDLEACLALSMEMSASEEKTSDSRSRPTSKQSSRKAIEYDSMSEGKDVSARSSRDVESIKRQRMDNMASETSLMTSPRSESKQSLPSTSSPHIQHSLQEEEARVLAESLRAHDHEMSDQALLDQALQASLEESIQQQYDTLVHDDLVESEEMKIQVVDDSEDELQKALALSLQSGNDVTSANDNTVNNNMTTNVATTEYCDEYMSMLMMEGMEDEDPELAMALQFSLQDQSSNNNE